ncbi:MAG: hypothetical protein FWE34_08035 [Defluviitaleaceae bacterium]|nr:hypothetical protein [Defluviitaleaceae bacterium]
MNKFILNAAKISFGIAIIFIVSTFLSSFSDIIHMLLGTVFLLGGLAFAIWLEKHHRHVYIFTPFAIPTLFIPFLHYFSGGILIYFACAMVFSRKKMVIS